MPTSSSSADSSGARPPSGNGARPTAPRLVPAWSARARLVAVAVTAPLLSRAGLTRLQRLLEPRGRHRRAPGGDPRQVLAAYGTWVDSLQVRGTPLVRRGCLTRGIALYDGLRRAGLDVELCFGVGSHAGSMEGHCWIEFDGLPVLEPADAPVTFTGVARVSSRGVTA
jgi:Transglutaminase-like superfamily